MISQTTIDEVRSLPIDAVVGKYETLKKTGSGYTCCCPFHNEKSPSFSLKPSIGRYKCFGCGAGTAHRQ